MGEMSDYYYYEDFHQSMPRGTHVSRMQVVPKELHITVNTADGPVRYRGHEIQYDAQSRTMTVDGGELIQEPKTIADPVIYVTNAMVREMAAQTDFLINTNKFTIERTNNMKITFAKPKATTQAFSTIPVGETFRFPDHKKLYMRTSNTNGAGVNCVLLDTGDLQYVGSTTPVYHAPAQVVVE